MKNLLLFRIILLFVIFSSVATAQAQDQYAGDRLIVKFNPSCRPGCALGRKVVTFGIKAVDELNAKYNCISAHRINNGKKSKEKSYTYVLQFSGPGDVLEMQKAYDATGCFEYTEPDHIGKTNGERSLVPNDTRFYKQFALNNDGSFPYDSAKPGADIRMEMAWGIEQGDTSIIVAIVDGGVKLDHTDLTGRIWFNHADIPGNGVDDDHNGYIDDVQGWNFSYSNNDPSDDEGHGTNVTGIIGANGNNNNLYAGMDWHCRLMILKGTDSTGHGLYSRWAEAITYAVDNGARVINLSLEGTNPSNTLQAAITYAYSNNVTVVACMGNYNNDLPAYPAACTHVIAVGATNAHDCRVNPFFWGGGSNYGSDISVVAPGNYIFGLDYRSSTSYTYYWGGTSQATPHVTGLASLLLAQDPTRTPDMVKHIIEVTADDRVGDPQEDAPGWDQYYGYGRINAYRALTYIDTHAGIVDADRTIDMKVYPNPSSGSINVQVREADIPMNYSLINSLGAVVSTGEVAAVNTNIDISTHPKGVYMMQFKGANGGFVQREVLK